MSKAERYSEGKSRVDLIDPDCILGLGHVMRMGAEKYSADNWKNSVGTEFHSSFVRGCYASLMRHLLAHMKGEATDPESGQSHMHHVMANAMFIQYYEREGRDDSTGSTDSV